MFYVGDIESMLANLFVLPFLYLITELNCFKNLIHF